MANVKVSIVTATFNLVKSGRVQHFRQCLESVHNQKYENFEHIVADGGSSDGTVEVLKEYEAKGWIKFKSQKDSGIYGGMNNGAKMATGKYVAFLNSDDFYHDENAIALSVKYLEEANADYSYAPVKMINEDGSLLDYKHPHMNPDIKAVFYLMPFCHQTMFTKKSVLEAENYFDTNFKSAGDYDFVIRLCLKHYKSVLVPNTFTTFRFGGLSDVNQDQSRSEVAMLYYNNFSKLTTITAKQSKAIYCNDFNGIYADLAWALKEYPNYFDFYKYVVYVTDKADKLWSENVILREVSRDFGFIYRSFVWQFFIKFRRSISAIIIPKGSRRRKLLAKIIKRR